MDTIDYEKFGMENFDGKQDEAASEDFASKIIPLFDGLTIDQIKKGYVKAIMSIDSSYKLTIKK